MLVPGKAYPKTRGWKFSWEPGRAPTFCLVSWELPFLGIVHLALLRVLFSSDRYYTRAFLESHLGRPEIFEPSNFKELLRFTVRLWISPVKMMVTLDHSIIGDSYSVSSVKNWETDLATVPRWIAKRIMKIYIWIGGPDTNLANKPINFPKDGEQLLPIRCCWLVEHQCLPESLILRNSVGERWAHNVM